jgi:2-iminobutanoate/2-iminopropanoate deaminase
MTKAPAPCLALLSILTAIEPASGAQRSPRYFATPGSKAPFSPAVRAGDMVYASGQIGIGPDGIVPPDMATAARYAMDHVARALKLGGAEMKDVVHCTVMLTDMSKWDQFNSVYVGYFRPGRLPARSAIGAGALALGASVEVECMAYRPEGKP